MRLRPRIVDWDSPSSNREATRKNRDEPRTNNELDTAGHFIVGFVDTFRKADTMSTPMAETTPRSRRPRRRFDDDFKAQAVRLVLDEGKSIGAVARDLDLTETALREWVQRARANRTRGRSGLTTAEREELTQLRKENRQLRLEREILKNAAAFFAKEPATRSR
jgi:transposase